MNGIYMLCGILLLDRLEWHLVLEMVEEYNNNVNQIKLTKHKIIENNTSKQSKRNITEILISLLKNLNF